MDTILLKNGTSYDMEQGLAYFSLWGQLTSHRRMSCGYPITAVPIHEPQDADVCYVLDNLHTDIQEG